MDNPEPHLLLETPRLRLRPFQDADLEALLAYRSDLRVARYQGWPLPYTAEMAAGFIDWAKNARPYQAGEWYQLAIELKGGPPLIGDVGFAIRDSRGQQAEIGLTLAHDYQSQGYASETLGGLLAHLFGQRGLHRVYASCDVDNPAASRALERAGFRREAHFIDNYWDRDHWTSEYLYALLEREWNGKCAMELPTDYENGFSG